MSYYFSNDLLNSPVINKNVDCSIPCNFFLYFMSCCPTKEINYFPPYKSDLIELSMILLSSTPYPVVFLLVCLAAYFRTSRSLLILIMVFLENFIVIFLKCIIQEPRPNYLCNGEYGYPSNHSCFFTCILFWFIAEEIFTPEFYQCKYRVYLIPFIIIYPFILYSRYYLNYHSYAQIFGGFFLGMFIGVGWFLINIKIILCTDNIFRELMIKFNIENNLTSDLLYIDDGYILLDEYQSLIKKEDELNDVKQKIKKFAKKVKNFEGLDNLNENFKEILNNNDSNKNQNNDVSNKVNDEEEDDDDDNELYGEEYSDENINEIGNNENNDKQFNKCEKPKNE